MNLKNRKSSRAAFVSPPELLVPLAIVAIIAGLLLPPIASLLQKGGISGWAGVGVFFGLFVFILLYGYVVEASAGVLDLHIYGGESQCAIDRESNTHIGFLDFSSGVKKLRMATKGVVVVSSCGIGYIAAIQWYPAYLSPAGALLLYSGLGLLLNALLLGALGLISPRIRALYTTRTVLVPC